ncbi:MAG: histone H1 [Solirubrobacteraceae bacterium]
MADLNQMAYRVVQHATEPEEAETPAQTSGRKGGLKGGKARAEKLSPGERSATAKKAAQARWRTK